MAAGRNVARLDADAVRDGDLADPHAGVLVLQELADLGPDLVAVPVELVRDEFVDRGPGAFLRD